MKKLSVAHLDRPSLADLAEIVRTEGCTSKGAPLGQHRRDEIAGDLNRIAKWLGLPLDNVPADPAWIRARFGDWNPATLGWSKRTATRVRSSLTRALAHLASAIPPLKDGALPPEWHESLQRFKERELARMSPGSAPHHYYTLLPFAEYCARRDINPDRINEETVNAYATFRATESVKKTSESKLKSRIYAAWKALADGDSKWPPVPDRAIREQVMWPLDRFSQSFQDEVRLYETNRGVADADSYDPKKVGYRAAAANAARMRDAAEKAGFRRQGHAPLSEETIQGHIQVIRRAATMLVRHDGVPVESIRRIADVITPDAAETILEDYDRRYGPNASNVTKSHDLLVFNRIALSWLRADKSMIEELRALSRLCKREAGSMSDEQRQVIGRFLGDPELTARLVCLPDKVMEAVERRVAEGSPTPEDALEFQSAVALMILLTLPVRGKSLVNTELQFILWPSRKGASTFLRWPDGAVKTRKPLFVELLPDKAKALRLYIDKYRPVLAVSQENPFLFPGRMQKNRMRSATRQRTMANVMNLVYRHLGVRVHGHLWRKVLASLLYKLTHNEKAVKALLGHSPNSRVTELYVENMRTMAAAGALDSLFVKIKDGIAERRGKK